MERDTQKFKDSLEKHKQWALDYFNSIKNNLLKKADEWQDPTNRKYDFEKGERVRREANKLKFQFNKKDVTTNYGYCSKLEKDVSFIPNVCQLDTQECFKHRSDK